MLHLPPSDETLNDQRARDANPTVAKAAQLFLAIECDRPLAGSARHSLMNLDEVVIGRGSERSAKRAVESGVNRLILQVSDRRMSGKHARLIRSGASWEFQDLGSRNGSLVDGEPVTTRPLNDGALIEVGHTFFSFRESLSIPVGTPGDLDARDLSEVPPAFATLVPELASLFETLTRVAKSTVPIILLGETGSGKELLARTIHELSGRTGPFVPINCGALPQTLVEAQLFGHARGAFSGATRDELGYVRSAEDGTLLLDEIADLPPPSQAALLRVLQEGEVVPVGTTRPVPVDVRIIAATHAPVLELVQSGAFRNDLFARLAGFRFVAPPLRERAEDLGLLVASLLPAVSSDASAAREFAPDAIRALLRHPWRRNIRELKQCLASAVVMAETGTIELAHVSHGLLPADAPAEENLLDRAAPDRAAPDRAACGARSSAPRGLDARESLRQELLQRFEESRGNVSQVARSMGRARVQIQRWMKRFDIDPSKFR